LVLKPEGRSVDKEAKSQELCKLAQQLLDESDEGGIVTLAQEVEAELRQTNRFSTPPSTWLDTQHPNTRIDSSLPVKVSECHIGHDTKDLRDQVDVRSLRSTIMPSIPFVSHGREKPVFLFLLASSYVVLTVMAADPTGSLPLPKFNIGNGLINIAALTALVGSSTVEALVLGNRGAAGLPWAALSIFGNLSVLKACVTGASPGWLRETIGARNSRSDSILGMSLDLVQSLRGESKARRNVGEAIGVVCKKHAVSRRPLGIVGSTADFHINRMMHPDTRKR